MPLAYGLIQPVDLPLPALPAALDGLRVAHVTDLHVTRPTATLSQLINQLTSLRLDLVCLTGDYLHAPSDLDLAVEVLERLTARLRPTLGCFGVMGNHDIEALLDATAALPIRWLRDRSVAVEGRPLDLLGLHHSRSRWPDAVALALHEGGLDAASGPAAEPAEQRPRGDRLRLMLCHCPDFAHAGREFDADLVLCGHTHGGQWRLPWGRAIYNATDLPHWMSSGVFRDGEGPLWCISRGVGTSGPPVRLWCPPHVPVYTLRRRTGPAGRGADFRRLMRW